MAFVFRIPSFLFLALTLAALLFLSGCLGDVSPSDKLYNSSNPSIYSPGQFVQPGLYAPLNTTTPCTCMVCLNATNTLNTGFWSTIWNTVKNLFSANTTEATLANSQCYFISCNTSTYLQIVGPYTAQREPAQCNLSGQTVSCIPRFFMLGQGANPGEFSLAQRYCAGSLTMPVLWATSKNGTLPQSQKLPEPPAASKVMCYLTRDQMPVVVYYAGVLWEGATSSDFKAFAAPYNNASANPPVSGPVVLTTEAMLDPYDTFNTPTGPQRLVNASKLLATAEQIRAYRAACPKCLVALALKDTFDNESGQPNLCPLEYFLDDATDAAAQARAAACAPSYSDSTLLQSGIRGKLATSVDLIGVGFILNEQDNLASCSAEGAMGRHLAYSRGALNQYYKPSVWYAVGISPGPTHTPGCDFTETDVMNLYNGLLSSMPGLVSSGIIGVAPYRFLDDPNSLPRECNVTRFWFTSTAASLDAVTRTSSLYVTLVSSTDPNQNVTVDDLLFKNDTLAIFADADGMQYEARFESGQVNIYLRGCQYGFRTVQGNTRRLSAYSWFSACQFYYTNQVSFETAALNPLGSQTSGTTIALQTPVMFSTNGMGPVCENFNSARMGSRAFEVVGAPPSPDSVPNVTSSTDPAEQQRIASLQCGACLSNAPMPKAFCNSSASFPDAACLQYAQMDDAALLAGLDPVLLRAIAVGESNLGDTSKSSTTDPLGEINGPACAMGPSKKAGCVPSLTADQMASYPSSYCSQSDLYLKAYDLQNRSHYCVVGKGVMQCTRLPNASYNPFNPYDSATCGASEFLDKNKLRYNGRLQFLQDTRANPATSGLAMFDPTKGGMSEGETEWYAAWLALQAYHGEIIQDSWLTGYAPRATDDTLVKYVTDQLQAYCDGEHQRDPNAECVPKYALNVIKRYNEGIQVCQNGCAYQACAST